MTLVFASNNSHKLREVRQILFPVTILSLQDIGCPIEVEETGMTLNENSHLKALAINEWIERQGTIQTDGVFADDTGLEIAALNGAPGVHTARWAQDPPSDLLNRRKALQCLQGCHNRDAQFRTVITLIRHGQEQQVEGKVTGHIAEQEKGEHGFGYDPLFIPTGYLQTFAQLSEKEKNSISHRARALEQLKKIL